MSILFFMPILKADTQSSPKKIVILKIPDRLPRTENPEEILCYYYESEEVIQSTPLVNLVHNFLPVLIIIFVKIIGL